MKSEKCADVVYGFKCDFSGESGGQVCHYICSTPSNSTNEVTV